MQRLNLLCGFPPLIPYISCVTKNNVVFQVRQMYIQIMALSLTLALA